MNLSSVIPSVASIADVGAASNAPCWNHPALNTMEPSKKNKLGVVSGVYVPVCFGILSVLMFLRFGLILGQVGLLGILGA